MVTYNQLLFGCRKKKTKKQKTPILNKCPQKKAVCVKLFIMKPKKPNSARRKVGKVAILKTSKKFVSYIPGETHNLQEFSNVLVRGGRVKDLPGIRYKMVRGVYDLHPIRSRRNNRSKYGMKWWFRPHYNKRYKHLKKEDKKDFFLIQKKEKGLLDKVKIFNNYKINKSNKINLIYRKK